MFSTSPPLHFTLSCSLTPVSHDRPRVCHVMCVMSFLDKPAHFLNVEQSRHQRKTILKGPHLHKKWHLKKKSNPWTNLYCQRCFGNGARNIVLFITFSAWTWGEATARGSQREIWASAAEAVNIKAEDWQTLSPVTYSYSHSMKKGGKSASKCVY